MIKNNIFVGSDVTSDGVSIVVRRGDEIIHAEFYAVPRRKPLSEAAIEGLANFVAIDDFNYDFARAIEKAHGIV